jgi:hypothetical protein
MVAFVKKELKNNTKFDSSSPVQGGGGVLNIQLSVKQSCRKISTLEVSDGKKVGTLPVSAKFLSICNSGQFFCVVGEVFRG